MQKIQLINSNSTRLFQHFDDAHYGITSGHDRIDNVSNVTFTLLWKPVIVLDREEILTVHTNVMNAGIGEQFEHTIDHSESGAQNWDKGNTFSNFGAGRINMVMSDGDAESNGLGGKGRRGFISKVEGDFSQRTTEFRWWRRR